MNSSSCILPDIDRKMLLQTLAIVEELLIDSIEFTVLREKGQFKSLWIDIRCLPKEKKKQIP